MPYTKEQRALFNAASQDPEIAEEHNLTQREAGKLAREANKLRKKGEEKHSSFIDLEPVFGPARGAPR